MERYSLIHTVLPREFVLLQGTGCRWRRCTFCDYHLDTSQNPYAVNAAVLQKVTGHYGVLDVINSGSAMELDADTLSLLQQVVRQKHIHTLWFEAHYLYRHRLAEFAAQFAPAQVKFRCGVETFNPTLRAKWHKGIAPSVQPSDVARFFQGICLLCCVEGQTREDIRRDISLARQHFEYFSLNVFCNNSTTVRRNSHLVQWFLQEVYPMLQHQPGIEVLIQNTDLGVGE